MDANYYDYLTKLPTMTYFFETSLSKKDDILKKGGEPCLLFIRLNGMKNLNQRNGFQDGNQYMQDFSEVLSSFFESGNCCRLGGVHFAVIADNTGIEDVLHNFFTDCGKIKNGSEIYSHVGIYQFKNEEVSTNIACDRAKLACDNLKNEHTSRIAYYNISIKHAEENHRYIIDNFQKAISERWLTVYYQPIVRAVNGRVCDEEALARWIDPVKGFLSPANFIPVLEHEKLIYKLDLYILERVIEKMKYMETLGIPPVSHSINLSRSDFESCDIVEEIRTRVDISGISRSKINIEITESVIGSDFDFMMKQILRFKQLGFSVWMDDFGSGYSSLNVLKEIPFDLIKFDMSFMRQFDENNNGKIILAELMKMAFAIGVDTVCEGVENENQLQFLKEIGCSKIQGFYYSKPNPIEEILDRIEKGTAIGFENPDETQYYETIGKINLQDLSVITYGNENDFNNVFNVLPMTIIELTDTDCTFVRSNQSYRTFFNRFFNSNLMGKPIPLNTIHHTAGANFLKNVEQVALDGKRSFIEELLPDGSTATVFIRRLSKNPVRKAIALAVGVLSIKDSTHGTTYANIAKALAADYYNLFYVNLDTEEFIEYSAYTGGDMMNTERHGNNFFEQCRTDARNFIAEEDREMFIEAFHKEKILRELDEQGRFAISYHLNTISGVVYANMKVMRMNQNGNFLIFAVSNVTAQKKQEELLEKARQDRIIYSRLMALSDDFLCMYIVEPNTEEYTEYNSSTKFDQFGIPKSGTDFFKNSLKNSERLVPPEDFETFRKTFSKENILKEIKAKGVFSLHYHLIIDGEAKTASIRAAMVKENEEDKLIIGIRM